MNLFLCLCKSNFTSILLISPFLSYSILYLFTWIFFYALANLGLWLSFPITWSLSHPILHQSTLIFFYFFINLNSRLSSSISPFISHSILNLSTPIFFYLLANLVDAYFSLLQILNSLSISHYLSLQLKKISPLLRYFMCLRRVNSFLRYSWE